MDILPIGGEYYAGRVRYLGGAALSSAPVVVLHSLSTRKYYHATVTVAPAGEVGHDATFPAAVTARMLPGVYALEVYADSNMTKLIAYDEYAARAERVAKTSSETDNTSAQPQPQINVEVEESESASESWS